MELDRLGVELRRRNGFESLDLGLAMLHAWRGPVLRAWLCTYWPVALVVSALLWNHPSVAYLVVWWLKPAFDRVLLHVYGAAMFGAAPGVRDTLRALPRLLGRTGLLAGLTVQRLSMARSLYLPVTQLEGQRGKAARARRRVLGARGYGYATWLTFFCANLIGIWVFSGLLLLLVLLPAEALPDFGLRELLFDDSNLLVAQGRNLFVFLADTLIEPYFVAAGFSLYLNRRSELEGWDLEVAFRRMARRRAGVPAAAATVAAVLLLALVVTPDPAHAQDKASPPLAAVHRGDPLPYPTGAIKRDLARVLEDPVFGAKEKDTRWVPRSRDDDERAPWLERLLRQIGRIMDAIARAGRVVVWTVGIAALAVALYLVIRYRGRWLRGRARREAPETLFGLDVRPQSLPPDIAAAARALLAAGDAAGALGLLYRGALSALVNFAAVDFRAGDTERDCWRRAGPALSRDGARYFRALLDAWLTTAYAHRPPAREDLARLCDEWGGHFRREAFATAEPA
jgi:hypothetical protein